MLRYGNKAHNLFDAPLNQAILAINQEMDSWREGDFIEIDQPDTGDLNWWSEYGAGRICRIIRMEKGEYPVRYSVKRSSDSNFYHPEINSRLPVWIVEGISDWHCGKRADLCKVDGSHSVVIKRTFILGETYFACVPTFKFLATYDEKNNQYIFSTQIRRADNLTIKRLLEQKIAEQEKQRKEQEERLLILQREQQAEAAISKESLDSLFAQLHK